jgi:hypothetical protein
MFVVNLLVAPVKATCQAIAGNTDAAAETFAEMMETTPILSHGMALIAKIDGNDAVAKKFWDSGNSATSSMINAIPVVGHAKGVVHNICGDHEGAKDAYLAATRTSTVLGAGAGGFLLAGPVGAVGAGLNAGVAWDAGTLIATNGKKANGVYKIVETIDKDPTDFWGYVDGSLGMINDGMTGYSGGKMAERVARASEIKTKENYREIRREKVADNQRLTKNGKPIKGTEVYAEAKDPTSGKVYGGSNKNVRAAINDPLPAGGGEYIKKNKYGGSTCAEPQALHKLMVDEPKVDVRQVRVNTIEVKQGGSVYPKARCVKCQTYKLGKVNTDPGVVIMKTSINCKNNFF